MAKSEVSGPTLARFSPNLVPKNFFEHFISTRCYTLLQSMYPISRKSNEPNLRKWQKKPLVFGPILATLAQMWVLKIFFMGFTSTRCYTLLQAIIVYNSRKTNKSNLTKHQKKSSF